MKVVGTSGGALSSSDGKLAVEIPAGALPSDVAITTEPVAAPAEGAVSTVYEIGPTGTQFAMPVTLTLHYDATALNGAMPSSLRVATYAGNAWQLLPGAVVDTQAKTVSGVTTHLSPYAIVTEQAGKVCASVPSSSSCGADAGTPTGGGSGGTDPGTAAAFCDPPKCTDAANACSQYPGASVDSCVDGPSGYTASCCFAPSAPICFAMASSFACDGSSAGGGTSCPAAPTCETATTACAGYPGATLQNCTNTVSGFNGACCFAPSAPVCVAVGAGRACGGSSGGGFTCPPPPRCADGNPCANYVGATVQSCTDTADGYTASCCFALGTLPVVRTVGPGNVGGTDGGVPASDGGTGTGGPDAGGTGGTGGGGTCAAGAACTAGYRCRDASPTGACMDCSCAADGTVTCVPCQDKPDAGGTTGTGATTGGTGTGGITGTTGTGGMTGGGTCTAGAACTAGYRCGAAVADCYDRPHA